MQREEAEGKLVAVELSVLLVVLTPRVEKGHVFHVMSIRD
jgi:hypothetical protein